MKGALIGTGAGAAVGAGIGRQMVKEAETGKASVPPRRFFVFDKK